jgi:TolA-binding protein
MKRIFTSVLAVVMVGATATLFAQSRQEQQMAAELRMLQEQQQQQALATAQLAEAIKALGPRFDEVIEAMRKRTADLELTVKNAGNDLSAIRAQTQDGATRLGSLGEEIEALRKSLESLPGLIIQSLPQGPAAPVDPNAPPGAVSQGPPVPVAPVQGGRPASTLGLSPAQTLGTAKGDYASGQYAAAIAGFEEVLKNFAVTAPQAAAEAQHYIGESYYLENKWAEAIAAYTLVIQNYPKSPFVADAYYKRGLAQERDEQFEAARASFEFAIKNFPDTVGGQLAKQGFDRVKGKVPQRPR